MPFADFPTTETGRALLCAKVIWRNPGPFPGVNAGGLPCALPNPCVWAYRSWVRVDAGPPKEETRCALSAHPRC